MATVRLLLLSYPCEEPLCIHFGKLIDFRVIEVPPIFIDIIFHNKIQ